MQPPIPQTTSPSPRFQSNRKLKYFSVKKRAEEHTEMFKLCNYFNKLLQRMYTNKTTNLFQEQRGLVPAF